MLKKLFIIFLSTFLFVTVVEAKKAGVDVFVAGSAIFHADNVTAATAELKNLIK